jgi:AAA15 family ATPase/GTPase
MRVDPFPMSPPFQTFFMSARTRISVSEEAKYYGNLLVRREEKVILEVLRLIEPRIDRIETIVVADKAILHGDIGIGRLIPLAFLGDGMARLTDLILYIANARNGVVLVDEIENGLHYSVMPKIWRAIGDAADHFNTQIFATTHSFECIKAAHIGLMESKYYDFCLHRLERVKGTIEAVTYGQENLESAIEEGLEVR